MGHRRHVRRFHPINKQSQSFLIDKFSVMDIRKWQVMKDNVLKFNWDYFSDLAYQRAKISEKIRNSLLDAVIRNFKFEHWQRAVKYKYALNPFSTLGSLIDPGGRFNIGDINPSQFSPFPALYIASDKITALQELLSQKIAADQESQAFDFALTNTSSVANISISGNLASVIDLNEQDKMQNFVDLIKNFTISDHLKINAKTIGLPSPNLTRTVPVLIDTLLLPNWRECPMQYDIPANSQIFGQLIVDAGIEGILYKSKFSGNNCLAIFPQNFDEHSGSFIQLDDEAPAEIKIRRLDAKIWNELKEGK